MKCLSLFAGIGGFDAACDRAGIEVCAQAEKDRHCLSVLSRHWPDVKRIDDVRRLKRRTFRPDLICGGFPCQDLSVAGRRAGLAGKRSGLWEEFARIIGLYSPAWVLIENVPGLLSSNKGRDMGTILGRLGELGYGFAYRVLDSQWFGLAQRRKRVFIVGCLGDARRACEVLFERESLPWHPAPSRETGERVAVPIGSGTSGSGQRTTDLDGVNIIPIDMRQASRGVTMTNNRSGGSSGGAPGTGIGKAGESCFTIAKSHTPAIMECPPLSLALNQGGYFDGTAETYVAHTLRSEGHNANSAGIGEAGDPMHALDSTGDATVARQSGIRRLTPTECERLQGFPDGHTAWGIEDGRRVELSDSARYRCLGNAVSVPVVEWVLNRLVKV